MQDYMIENFYLHLLLLQKREGQTLSSEDVEDLYLSALYEFNYRSDFYVFYNLLTKGTSFRRTKEYRLYRYPSSSSLYRYSYPSYPIDMTDKYLLSLSYVRERGSVSKPNYGRKKEKKKDDFWKIKKNKQCKKDLEKRAKNRWVKWANKKGRRLTKQKIRKEDYEDSSLSQKRMPIHWYSYDIW